jgi:hypothetical protein
MIMSTAQSEPPLSAQAPRHPRLGAWSAPVLALALLCVALAVVLAVTPLWETPDTYCERIITHPSGHGGAGECLSIAGRRKEWIALIIGVGLLLFVVSAFLRRVQVKHAETGRRWVAVGLMAATVGFGTTAGVYLTYGHGHDSCGSTLSRIDPRGEYFRGTPEGCAPFYSASRLDATIFGCLAFGAWALGTVTTVRRPQPADAPAMHPR